MGYSGLRTVAWLMLVAFALQGAAPWAAQARVLEDADLARVRRIKFSFTDVVAEVSRSSQRADLSSGESECIKSTLRALMQISDDLRPYENLITIEGEMTDFGDDSTLRNVVRFAVTNALKILKSERRRMDEVTEQCSRFPVSADKTRRAIQFIDGTTEILLSIQPRL